MRRLYIALAMTGMLLLGLIIGSVFTRTARADTPTIPNPLEIKFSNTIRYQIIPVQRVDKTDPLAIKFDTYTGQTEIIR